MKTTVTVTWMGATYQINTRDTQRERLYRAEWLAFSGADDVLGARTLEDAQRYAEHVLQSETFSKLRRERGFNTPAYKLLTVERAASNSSAQAFPAQWRIRIPDWGTTKHVILHELAHLICGPSVGHHWTFVRAYEDLVSRFMGAEQARGLRAAYKKYKVKRAPPRRMTDEQRAALAARGTAALAKWKSRKDAA